MKLIYLRQLRISGDYMNEKVIYFDSDNLETIVSKMDLKLIEEKEIYDKINDCFNGMNNVYKSNQIKLDMVESELLLNITKMINNHENNIYLIKKRIEAVRNTRRKVNALDDSVSLGRIE